MEENKDEVFCLWIWFRKATKKSLARHTGSESLEDIGQLKTLMYNV